MRKIFLTTVAVLLGLTPLRAPLAGTDTVETRSVHSGGAPRFTLNDAILTALQRNPDIQRARQDIERAKGLYLELRAQALPRLDATGNYSDTDPELFVSKGGPVVPGSGSTFTSGTGRVTSAYNVEVRATQVVFAGGRVVSQIRGADFQRDSAYFGFRNVIDQVIATVRQQFYQVLLNRGLIDVQEESVELLRRQLQDQQNRFEAGTVPRFNVLQAQVALSNQIPNLITAQNNFRISRLQMARTIGLDLDPADANQPPLEAVGQLFFDPRILPLEEAIRVARERRPSLKQQKANILNSAEQVRVARSGFFPQVNATAGYQGRSSIFSSDVGDVSTGTVVGLNGNWAIWDMGATYGRMKQARAVLQESKITYEDAVRQVDLEVQQAYSNLQQNRELFHSQEKNVEQAEEAQRLAKARLDAGAGTQLDVLNAQVQLATARSTRLQALAGYNATLAEFDRVTSTETTYSNELDDPRTRNKVKTEAAPTPAPKPTPLPLNHAGNRKPVATSSTRTRTTTTIGGGK
ncbi:MAG: TolC family protein [Verrucomicrobiota bacterium]|nr:TolC family protein [Verrucomicrobiota bacterium]